MTACALRNEIEAAVAWMEAAAGLLSHGWLYRGGRQTGCFGTGLIPSVVFTVQCFAIHNACGPILRPHSVKRVLQIHEMLKIVYSKYAKCRFSRSLARCAPKVFRMWAIFLAMRSRMGAVRLRRRDPSRRWGTRLRYLDTGSADSKASAHGLVRRLSDLIRLAVNG